MTSNKDQALHPASKSVDERVADTLRPKKVNYRSNGKTLEVQFYRDQNYVGRVTFDNALQRDEPIGVDFYCTEEFPYEERDRLTEEAFAFGTAAIDSVMTGWAEVALDCLPTWNRPAEIVSAWSKEPQGEIMEQWKSDDDSRVLYRYPKADPESGHKIELTQSMGDNMVSVLDEATV